VSTPQQRAGPPSPGPLDGPALLERAVGYTRACLQLVATTDLRGATPCSEWDLHALLRHMNDSLAAFTEAAEVGYVDLVPVRGDQPGAELVDRLRNRACALLAAWAHHPGPGWVRVDDRELPADLLATAGALEIAVHGWDVAQACGVDRPLPPGLALELLDALPVFVTEVDRPGRFADPLDVPPRADPGTRLLAALGRA
jgi:uncharacterized protein (TIGR03086 family)